jgi:large subunit ribosomal protein L4
MANKKLPLYSSKAEVIGEVKLSAELVGLTNEEINASEGLLHQVVTAEKNYLRQGTHKTKTRGEVSGGGKKPFRQKGTGNARQGSSREPQHKGGGIVHGPVPRFYDQKINKKMFQKSLSVALSNRFNNNAFYVISDFGVKEGAPKTSTVVNTLSNLEIESKSILVVLSKEDFDTYYAARNLENVDVITANSINSYNVIANKTIIFTKDAIVEFTGDEKTVTVEAPKEITKKEPSATKKKAEAK